MLYHVKISCFKAFDDNERTIIFEGYNNRSCIVKAY